MHNYVSCVSTALTCLKVYLLQHAIMQYEYLPTIWNRNKRDNVKSATTIYCNTSPAAEGDPDENFAVGFPFYTLTFDISMTILLETDHRMLFLIKKKNLGKQIWKSYMPNTMFIILLNEHC